jgi:hypothetical protein
MRLNPDYVNPTLTVRPKPESLAHMFCVLVQAYLDPLNAQPPPTTVSLMSQKAVLGLQTA